MKIIIAFLLALLFTTAASAEEPVLLDDPYLSVELVDLHAEPGCAHLTLRCISTDDHPTTVTLLMPEVNGAPAGFRYGWPLEEIILAPSESQQVQITLETDMPDEIPQTLSFRFSRRGVISSPFCLQLDPQRILAPASFTLGAEEPPLCRKAVTAPEDLAAYAILLQDALPTDKLPLLDYGRAQICLQMTVGDEEVLIPFTSILAEIDASGQVRAAYSGLALVCEDAPGFPLRTAESSAKLPLICSADGMSLSGTYVFYAALTFSLSPDPVTGGAEITGASVDCLDIPGMNEHTPLAMFDLLDVSHPMYTLHAENGRQVLRICGNHAMQKDLTEPLAFALVPVSTLGDIAIYFEFFFTDGTDVIHAPFPLTTGLTGE